MLSLYLLIPTLILSLAMLGTGAGLFCLIGLEDYRYYTFLYGGSSLLGLGGGLLVINLVLWTIYGVQKKRERKTLERGTKMEEAGV